MYRSSLIVTVKTALKSDDFQEITDKNKLVPFLWLTVYIFTVCHRLGGQRPSQSASISPEADKNDIY